MTFLLAGWSDRTQFEEVAGTFIVHRRVAGREELTPIESSCAG
jgi:hypothetical protein